MKVLYSAEQKGRPLGSQALLPTLVSVGSYFCPKPRTENLFLVSSKVSQTNTGHLPLSLFLPVLNMFWTFQFSFSQMNSVVRFSALLYCIILQNAVICQHPQCLTVIRWLLLKLHLIGFYVSFSGTYHYILL